LLKCGTASAHDCMDQFKCDPDIGYHHNKSNGGTGAGAGGGAGSVGPPDIIPVPYFTTTSLMGSPGGYQGGGSGSTSVTCCDNDGNNCSECCNDKSTCSR